MATTMVSMSTAELKQAEARGYAKGYTAGKRRKAADVANERQRAREQALWQRAMLVAIPFAMQQSDWKRGQTRITTIEDRMRLAAEVADEALGKAKDRYRV